MKKICSKSFLCIAIMLMIVLCMPRNVFADDAGGGIDDNYQRWTIYGDFGYRVLNEGTSNEEIIIGDYHGSDTEVTIPDEIDGKPVTVIGMGMFFDCSEVTKVTMPDTIKIIARGAFESCTALTDITLPDSVEEIYKMAFYKCSSLPTINIPENVKVIGDYAFAECSSLDGITIPEGVKTIGEFAFTKTGITSITVPATVETVGLGAISYCSELKTATFKTGIGVDVSGNPLLEEVTLLEGSTIIEERQFENCGNLSTVKIPDTVTEIGEYAFSGCSSMYNFVIPGSIKSIGERAFNGCTSLADLTISDGVEEIGNSAFVRCLSLKNVDIPQSVKEIGARAFENTGLTTITIPKTVESIGQAAFSNNSRLKSATFMSGNGVSFESCAVLEDVTILDGSTKIDANLFNNCGSLASVKIPDTITEIGENAFASCASLVNVTIPESVKTIGAWAFCRCTSLADLTISDGVEEIGKSAFYKCTSLESVDIPQSVTEIGVQAFCDTGLTSIVIPNTVKSLGVNSFGYNSKLKSATFMAGTGVSFSGCPVLDDVTILDGSTKIDDQLFYDCGSLVSVKIPDTVTEIGEYAFADCPNLEKADIPDGVTFIGEAAFYNTGLAEVTIPGTVTTIGDFAFEDCANLKKVTMNTGIKNIGSEAFAGCPNLENIDVPDSVETVGDNAFDGISGFIYDISKPYFKPDVSGIKNTTYTGKQHTQADLKIVVNGKELKKDTDYTVKYSNNVNAGKAGINIEFKGQYTGSITRNFTIAKADFTKTASVSGLVNATYTGKAITQNKLAVKAFGAALKSGTDYTVSYKNNINAGKAEVTITGKGSYSGTIKKTFNITIPKNRVYTVGTLKYKVTNAATNGKGTVTLVGTTNKKNNRKFTSLTVNSAVRIGGVKYNVTAVGDKAFGGYTYLKKVVVGSGVKTIGTGAFRNCKRLNSITIKSKNLTKVGKYAFSKTAAKPVVRIQKTKAAKYKRLLKNAGMTSKAVYKLFK